MAGAVADAAVADAAGTEREELVARFAVQGRRALDGLRVADPTTLVSWPASGGVVTLAEGRIMLMESTVHLLDVHRALDLDLETIPPAALAETAGLLAQIAPAVEFIEAATGRAAESPLPVLR